MQELIIIIQVVAMLKMLILENNFHDKVLLLFAKFVVLEKGTLQYKINNGS